MREAVRCQYLKAMGIPVWVPRQELPHAAPSRVLPLLGTEHLPHADGELPADHLPDYRRQADHRQGGHMAAQLFEHQTVASAPAAVASRPVVEERPEAVAVVDAPAPAASEDPVDLTPPRFELYFVKYGDELIWVCDRGDQLGALMSFAARVNAAMGWETLRSEPVGFHWPFIEHALEDQGAAVAEQALRAQWSYFSHNGGRHVIALGSQSRKWLSRINVPGCYMDEDVLQIMANGALKKQLWQRLLELPSGKS